MEDLNADEYRESIKRKYAEERAKRIREDASDQYVDPSGEFAHYLDDPHTPPIEREPRTEEVDAVIIGAGFGGLLAASRLREAGLEKVRIIEKAGGVGGTWYWNRYPGAQCDIESYMYMPLLEETGHMPTERYARGPEIREHAERIAKHFGLLPDILFQTQLTEAKWDEERLRWIVRTDRGDELAARFICSSSGSLNRPKLPGIPGLERFQGHSFHTSRWDYAYTGGSETSPLEGLRDKRVGIVGTGATSLQAVPMLAKDVKELYVFQRTPSTVGVRGNRPTDPDWFRNLEPGWQSQRLWNFHRVVTFKPKGEDLVRDGWTELTRLFFDELERAGGPESMTPGSFAKLLETAKLRRMEDLRARVDEIVEDSATAESLKPWYDLYCKRPGFHDEYLASFNRPNVTLVDTDGRGIDELTPTGAVVAGKTYDLDCIIFATGFQTAADYTQKSDFEFIGRGGRTLSEHWGAGIRTFHGWGTDGFPNLFFMMNAQGGQPFNYVWMLDQVSQHLSFVVGQMKKSGALTVEPRTDTVDGWVERITRAAKGGVKEIAECTPGYYNGEGRISERGLASAAYAGGDKYFFEVLQAWRETGDLEGMSLGFGDEAKVAS